jgi:hypothetical protein
VNHYTAVQFKMADNGNNPGKVMAAAVDAEIAAFQKLQSELQQYRADQQVLLSQQNENEMVKQVSFDMPKRGSSVGES